MHSLSSSLARKLLMTSTWPVVQIRCSAQDFGVRNRETLGSLCLGRVWPIFSILASCGPTHQGSVALGGGFEPKPSKPLLARLRAMHSGWSTTVTHSFLSPSRLPHGPSEVLHSCRSSAPPCTKPPWPADVEILILASCPSEGLLPVGGLLPRPVEVFSSIDNHSSSESNEAGPLALNLPLDECIVNTPICINR